MRTRHLRIADFNGPWQRDLLHLADELKAAAFDCPACHGSPGRETGDPSAVCGQCEIVWHLGQALESYAESLPFRAFRHFKTPSDL